MNKNKYLHNVCPNVLLPEPGPCEAGVRPSIELTKFGIIKIEGVKYINKEYALLKLQQSCKSKIATRMITEFINTLFYGE